MHLSPALPLAALALLPAIAARAEPLDLDLARLGAPHPIVQARLNGGSPDDPANVQAAGEARARFARLASQLALSFSAPLLQPASTTGYSGFDVALEGAYVGVRPGGAGGVSDWPTRSMQPHELTLASVHVRKALPFSLEVGGRMIYLSQSSCFGAQVEGKWALNEGIDLLPEVAVRGAWTEILGARDLNLGTAELDLIVSKRWAVGAFTALTPYLAARYAWVFASSEMIDFEPAAGQPPADAVFGEAAFPALRGGFYRTTAGLRVTSRLVSLAAEATWFPGSTQGEPSAADPNAYPRHRVPASWGGAARVGLEF